MNEQRITSPIEKILKDANIRFPAKPCLANDIDIYVMPQGLGIQFHGGASPVYLRGKRIVEIMDYLKEVLDGSHSLEDIKEGCPDEQFEGEMLSALYQLHSKGLIAEKSPGEPPADPVLDRQRLFWGRKLGITGFHATGEVAQDRLRTSNIVLIGSGLFGSVVYDLLDRSGCSNFSLYSYDDTGIFEETISASGRHASMPGSTASRDIGQVGKWLLDQVRHADLVITAIRNGPEKLFQIINRICLDHDVPWIYANDDGSTCQIGPLVLPYESSCYSCMEIRKRSSQKFPIEDHLYQEHLANGSTQYHALQGEALASATLSASFLTTEVIRHLTAIVQARAINRVFMLDLVKGYILNDSLLRLPRCPECSTRTV